MPQGKTLPLSKEGLKSFLQLSLSINYKSSLNNSYFWFVEFQREFEVGKFKKKIVDNLDNHFLMEKTVVVVPAWGQKAESNWYPYLSKNLEGKANVKVLDTPPTSIDGLVDYIEKNVENEKDFSQVFFVCHSVG